MREEREKKRQGLKWCAGVLTLVLTVVLVCPVQAEQIRAKVQIPVRCEAQTDSESFTYDLSGEGSVHETVETGTLILKNGEKGMFTVYYDDPDMYHYTVSERQGAENKTIYDSTVYQVDVYVTWDADGKLHADAAAYVKGSTEKKAELDFHNRQRSSDSPSHRKHKGNTESDTAENRSDIQDISNPKTGDTAMPVMFMVLAVLSAAGIVLIRHIQKKGDGEDA